MCLISRQAAALVFAVVVSCSSLIDSATAGSRARRDHSIAKTAASMLFAMDGRHRSVKAAIPLLERADAVRDAEAAIQARDRRLLCVRGYALEIPGAERFGGEVPPDYTAVAIQGTGDAIETPEQARFQDLVRRYAKRYNAALLAAHGR